jgi:hypothetical protein
MMLIDDINEKTNETVVDVLKSNHPEARIPDSSSLPSYTTTPDYVDLDILEDAIEGIGRHLSGTVGLGGTDSHALKHWLLQFGTASQNLRQAMALFTEWMSNTLPLWAAYQALMAGHLVELDKCPGI